MTESESEPKPKHKSAKQTSKFLVKSLSGPSYEREKARRDALVAESGLHVIYAHDLFPATQGSDIHNGNMRVVTHCWLVADVVLIAAGVAICSPRDQYARKVGNWIAYGRAIKALKTRDSSQYVGDGLYDELDTTVSFLVDYRGWPGENLDTKHETISGDDIDEVE